MADKCECGSSWTEDELGSQSIKVCESCGKCLESVAYEADSRGGSSLACAGGPTNEGKFHAKKDPLKIRERRFLNFIKEAATKAQLNREGTDICIGEAKSLLARDEVLGKMEKIAIGIVFLEVRKRTPTLSFQYFANKFEMRRAVLGRVVKTLQAVVATDLNREDRSRLPFETRLEAVLDRMDNIQLKREERKELKELAKDLKQLCSDVPVNGNRILDNEMSDFAYFAMALVYLQNLKESNVVTKIAKEIGLNYASFKNSVLKIRIALLILAKEIPSLEHLEGLSTRSIPQYIPLIRRNKAFLLSGTERLKVADLSDQHAAIPLELSSSSLPSGWEGESREDEGTLSDLDPDIDQYIASDKEVRKKRKLSRSGGKS